MKHKLITQNYPRPPPPFPPHNPLAPRNIFHFFFFILSQVVHPHTRLRLRVLRRLVLPRHAPRRLRLSRRSISPRLATVHEERRETKQRHARNGADDDARDCAARKTAGATTLGLVRGALAAVRVLIIVIIVIVIVVVGSRSRLVEARHALLHVRQLDEADVGAGVKGLVLRGVKVGNVLDLEGGVGAGGDARGGVGDGDAGVPAVEFLELLWVDDGVEVVVGLWVCDTC